LELDVAPVNRHHPRAELHPNGQVVHRLEALVRELQQEAALSHPCARDRSRQP